MTDDQLGEYFFNPHGVAVIGASADPAKLSYGVIHNLITHGYRGPIYPINPRGGEIQGLTAYPSILNVPDPVELAVIMIRAEAVPEALGECGKRGLKAVIVVTGGFRETGPEGAALEASLKDIAVQYGMRLIGPNCVGVMDAHLPLDTTFITMMPEPGHIAFVSHSGAICGGSIDWARSVGVGYSRIASLGNQLDVDIADGIRMMKDDPNTRVISVYAEGLPDGRRFVEAAASVYREKPIVMLKAGLTAAGTQAVASHTGALAGNNDAYVAACHRAGVVRVHSLQEQNDVAMALATQPLPRGNRVALLTNAGGPAALAADALDGQRLVMAPISAATQARLKAVTPPGTQLGNPIDMLGGPRAEMYSAAGKILLEDPDVDMLITMFVPQAITPVDEVVREMVKTGQDADKPVVACLVGGESLTEAIYTLNRGGVPYYRDPNRAGRALGGLWEYRQLRARPDLTPTPVTDVDRAAAQALLDAAWAQHGAGFLDAETAAQVAAAYGIAIPFSGLAASVDEAVALAEQAGYPVVLKRIAADVVHKADVGGAGARPARRGCSARGFRARHRRRAGARDGAADDPRRPGGHSGGQARRAVRPAVDVRDGRPLRRDFARRGLPARAPQRGGRARDDRGDRRRAHHAGRAWRSAGRQRRRRRHAAAHRATRERLPPHHRNGHQPADRRPGRRRRVGGGCADAD
jgi:acetate---CoA ligase (ADP-forming)